MKCQENCKSEAIIVDQENDTKKPIFNYNRCTSSFRCLEVCPEEVIHNRKLKHRDLIFLLSITLGLLIAAVIIGVT
jgi:MinD superfamily P-loop ATPase